MIEQFYPVVREPAPGLPDRTLYRPAVLSEVDRHLPIVIWSNGGCRRANSLFITTLMLFAAHGFIVIAYGPPDASSDEPVGTPHPERVVQAIDWITESDDARRYFEDRADPAKIAVVGQSCGGLEALAAAKDPRVGSTVSLNIGFYADPDPVGGLGRDLLGRLHSPVLFIYGGPTDAAGHNAPDNYALVDVPAALATNAAGGHARLFYGIPIGRPDDGTITLVEQTVTILVQWLDFTLNGRRTARNYLLEPAGLRSVPGWTIQTKNL